jgi:hypothetical protein
MMMTTIKPQRRVRARVVRYATFCLLALVAVLCQSRESQAQWATSGTNTTTTNNVGIGTTTPGKKLEVLAADGEAARLYRNANSLNWGVNIKFALNNSSNSLIDYAGLHGQIANPAAGAEGGNMLFTTATAGVLTEKMRLDSSGNLGIGTTTPGIINGISYSSYVPLHIQGTASRFIVIDSSNSNSGIVLNDSSQPVDNRIWTVSQSAGSGKLTFSTYTDVGATSTKVVIDRSGNFGIGTSAPSSKLHVVGDITVSGNINAKYQDVAEWVPSTLKLNAGTVVILDSEHNNHVTVSSRPYDTRVAGVVSAQPGITLGEAGEGKTLVATTGRVKVRVDATRAPIHVGDLLVTSEMSGVAMRSEPLDLGGVPIHRPGTLIGKALESLDKGTGEILVLLSLQ